MAELVLATTAEFYAQLEAHAAAYGVELADLVGWAVGTHLPRLEDSPRPELHKPKDGQSRGAHIAEDIDNADWQRLYDYARRHSLNLDDIAIALIERYALTYRR